MKFNNSGVEDESIKGPWRSISAQRALVHMHFVHSLAVHSHLLKTCPMQHTALILRNIVVDSLMPVLKVSATILTCSLYVYTCSNMFFTHVHMILTCSLYMYTQLKSFPFTLWFLYHMSCIHTLYWDQQIFVCLDLKTFFRILGNYLMSSTSNSSTSFGQLAYFLFSFLQKQQIWSALLWSWRSWKNH